MPEEPARHYFVDEAGDLTLFGRRGKSMLGTEGVSSCFMVGVAHILNLKNVTQELAALHRRLLEDPYLRDIPSMQPEARKTARCFHAKNDCAEVRMEVFRFLAQQDIKVQVGIRRKESVLREARRIGDSWNANRVYDDLIKTLFKRSLHKAASVIYFARRGNSPREKALQAAVDRARENFVRDHPDVDADKPVRVIPSVPTEQAGLQVIDYFLWALQRLYERHQDRYFEFLREHYRLIMDFDDKRRRRYGEWYSDQNPLSKEKMKPVTG